MKRKGEHPDYEDLEEKIEDLWDLLESEKFHFAYEECQTILKAIEADLADDFGLDPHTATLYDDPHEERRECYLETLQIYQRALRGLIIEIIIETDDIKDIDRNWKTYHALQEHILKETYKVAYLLGENYSSKTFITCSDVETLYDVFRNHCQFLLKQEFFKKFKIVIQTLGNLNRKNFHKVTEPYKNLRNICHECLRILEVMRDSRFFGEHDTFIEDYERDIKIYLQILWYLAIKTDLNKSDKFLNPNTYNKGLDQHLQIFAALFLMAQVIPHLVQARAAGLSDQATTALLEEYAEYLYKILTHEEARIMKDGLQQVQETEKILAGGYSHGYDQEIDLSIPEEKRAVIEETYRSLTDCQHMFGEMLSNEAGEYLHQDDSKKFAKLLEKAARGTGLQEEFLKTGQEEQNTIIKPYRYEFRKSSREREPAVFAANRHKTEIRLLHNEWVEDLYTAWKAFKKLNYMKDIVDGCTRVQEKIKYRMQFAFKFFKKAWFAFRIRKHKRIAVPNPEGRVLLENVSIDQALKAMHTDLFFSFFEELKMRHRSRFGIKLQRLRWAWFAERELKEAYFEKPKYNYLQYIHSRWKEKVKEHYRTLRRLSKRGDDDN